MIFLLLGFVGLITYLLVKKHIGSVAFTSLIIVFIISAIAWNGFDRLEKIDLKNLTVNLRELKQIRADVYAKQESVEKLSNQVFTTFSQIISKLGTWGQEFTIEELIDFRNSARDIFEDSNKDRMKIKELLFAIDERIMRESRMEIVRKMDEMLLEHAANKTLDMSFEQTKNDVHNFVDKDDYEGLLEYLKKHRLAEDELLALIQKRKIITGKLRIE